MAKKHLKTALETLETLAQVAAPPRAGVLSGGCHVSAGVSVNSSSEDVLRLVYLLSLFTSAAPGLARWCRIQGLTRPGPASGLVQGGVARDHGPWLPWGASPGPPACTADVLTAPLWNHVLEVSFYAHSTEVLKSGVRPARSTAFPPVACFPCPARGRDTVLVPSVQPLASGVRHLARVPCAEGGARVLVERCDPAVPGPRRPRRETGAAGLLSSLPFPGQRVHPCLDSCISWSFAFLGQG